MFNAERVEVEVGEVAEETSGEKEGGLRWDEEGVSCKREEKKAGWGRRETSEIEREKERERERSGLWEGRERNRNKETGRE